MGKNKTNQLVEEAKVDVADDIAEMELAKMANAELAEHEERKQGREQLIAEAYKLTGRIEGVNFISELATVSTLMMLKEVKEQKIYRDMPGIGTWEDYCKLTNFSRRHIDEQLQNLNELGQNLLAMVATFGIGYKDMRKLRSATSDGTLAITDQTITISVIDGQSETISLEDKDALKEALEELISAKDEVIAAKEREVDGIRKLSEMKAKYMQDTEKALIKAETKLREYEGGNINGMPTEDYPPFEKMKDAVGKLNEVFFTFKALMDMSDTLSDANRHYLANSVIYMIQLGVDLKDETRRSLIQNYIDFDIPADADLKLKEDAIIPGVNNKKGHKSKA